jgi:hypothetical protein
MGKKKEKERNTHQSGHSVFHNVTLFVEEKLHLKIFSWCYGTIREGSI